MNCCIYPLTDADLDECIALWRVSEGINLNESDTKPNLIMFLRRNPAMSCIAKMMDDTLAGAVLCGHDGRRGYLHHLAVDKRFKGQGIAKRLINACFDRLRSEGILKCNIFVLNENFEGARFWDSQGWIRRDDFFIMQKEVTPVSESICRSHSSRY